MTKQRNKRFGIVQTSLISAIVLFFTTLIFIIPMALFMGAVGGSQMPGFALGGVGLIIVMPFMYGIVGFIMTAISCAIYNWVATWTGGIEFDLELSEEGIQHKDES